MKRFASFQEATDYLASKEYDGDSEVAVGPLPPESKVFKLRKRPFFTRLKRHYVNYRAVGLSRWRSFTNALRLAML